MIDRTEYPAGVPCWIDLATRDVDAAVAFYAPLFGWTTVERAPAGVARYVAGQLDGLDVAAIAQVEPSEAHGGASWRMFVCVEDADAAAERVRAAGGRVLDPPAGIPGAGISAWCADPGGACFGLWQPMGRIGAQRVNVHGSWNFNQLVTGDPTGAEEFYRAVFGWVAQRLDFGDGQATMWRRPGYGDFLSTLDPDLRRRHAEVGLEGFSDAVAWMAPAAPDAPAVWDLTFAADDTDAIVDRARELGGTVLSGPEDVGPTRTVLLADPQGARFTVATYTPG